MGQRKSGLIRQVSLKSGSIHMISSMTRKKLPFNTGDCLIEVTTWTGLTVYDFQTKKRLGFFFANLLLK